MSCPSNVHRSNRLKSLLSSKIPATFLAPARPIRCEWWEVLLRFKSTEALGYKFNLKIHLLLESDQETRDWCRGSHPLACGDPRWPAVQAWLLLHVHRFSSSSFILAFKEKTNKWEEPAWCKCERCVLANQHNARIMFLCVLVAMKLPEKCEALERFLSDEGSLNGGEKKKKRFSSGRRKHFFPSLSMSFHPANVPWILEN